MKLSESIFFSLAVATFIIGVHQSFFIGVVESYWLFMLSAAFLMAYRYIKVKGDKAKNNEDPAPNPNATKTSKNKARSGKALKSK